MLTKSFTGSAPNTLPTSDGPPAGHDARLRRGRFDSRLRRSRLDACLRRFVIERRRLAVERRRLVSRRCCPTARRRRLVSRRLRQAIRLRSRAGVHGGREQVSERSDEQRRDERAETGGADSTEHAGDDAGTDVEYGNDQHEPDGGTELVAEDTQTRPDGTEHAPVVDDDRRPRERQQPEPHERDENADKREQDPDQCGSRLGGGQREREHHWTTDEDAPEQALQQEQPGERLPPASATHPCSQRPVSGVTLST